MFHDIEGSFGQGKKAMLVKEIANIHARQEPHINELINNNIKRFKDGVDIINLLSSEDFKIVVDDLGLRTSNRQKYSYLLSERGYSKLLKILEDDVAWEQYEYFNKNIDWVGFVITPNRGRKEVHLKSLKSTNF
ncbi:MAG: ORF6N domain-containing protein [Clostridium paraputrificum]